MAGKVKLAKPLAEASGKVFGAKSNTSLRTNKKTKETKTYTWPENYVYPQIPARQEQTQRLRQASLKYNEVKADAEKMRVFQSAFEKQKGKLNGKEYTDLRHFIIAWFMQQEKNGAVEM